MFVFSIELDSFSVLSPSPLLDVYVLNTFSHLVGRFPPVDLSALLELCSLVRLWTLSKAGSVRCRSELLIFSY